MTACALHCLTACVLCLQVLWQGYPPEVATWEEESAIHDEYIDQYEADLEAEAELEAREAEEDGESEPEDEPED